MKSQHHRQRIKCTLLAACVGVASAQAWAQSAPVLPQIDSSRVEERVRQAVPQRNLSRPSIPLLDGLEAPSIAPDAGAEGVTLSVSRIQLPASSVFTPEQLQAQVQGAIGQAVTLADLNQAVHNISSLYHKAGYVFSKAYIPQQTLADNIVRIELVEGYVGQVEFRGAIVDEDSALARYGRKLSSLRPLRQDQLERYVLLMNDLGGIDLQVLASGVQGQPGNLKLVMLVDEQKGQLGSSLNNYGSDSLGPFQAVQTLGVNNLTGLNEQTSLVHLRSVGNNELRYYGLSQSWPLGDDGLTLQAGVRHSVSLPGDEARSFDLNGRSTTYDVGLTYPWIRSRKSSLFSTLSFDARDSETDSASTRLVDDKLRYLRLESRYNRLHAGGASNAMLRYSQGLSLLDATDKNDVGASRAGGDGSASKLELDLQRDQFLGGAWSLRLQATGQLAFGRLLSAELFGVGGSEYGRAFDFSAITGDSGYAASAQLNRAIILPEDWAQEIQQMTLYGFADTGYTYDRSVVNGDRTSSISTAGVGLDVRFLKHFSTRLEAASPLKSGASDTLEPEFRISTGVNLGF